MVRRSLRVWCAAAALVAGIAFTGSASAQGPYSRLQVLLPGETAAPGTPSGKTGTPQAQTSGVPFSVTVRACDSGWNLVPATTNAIQILASDASATLPATAQLVGGTRTVQVTFNAGGTFTVFAHDQTDNTIPDGASASVQSLVLQGFRFAGISQKHKYAGVPDGTTITAIDAAGQTVSGFSGQVHLREITSFGDGRITPEFVTFSNGTWSGNVTMYRADESSINRGNANMYAFLDAAPQKNGTSDPFIVHPGPFSRLQLLVPGESPLPGSVSGKVGSPATQSAGDAFIATVWATDAYWNPVPSADNVRLTSNDANASTPLTGVLTNGTRTFNVSLGTVGTQTLTIADLTNGSIQGMTSAGIPVIPSGVHHFEVSTISSPQTAGVPVAVTIRAADSNGNTIPGYAGDAVLVANTGAGSITPEFVTFTAGVWAGPMVFKGAGGAVSFAAADFSAPPHTGSSNTFTVNPGPFSGVQVLLPGQTPRGGTADGKEGNPTPQQAGTAFTLTVRAVDNFWNLVNTVSDSIAFGSIDQNSGLPARAKFIGGQALIPTTLYRTGAQRIWANDITTVGIRPDTSSAVTVNGGPFARVLVLCPGEFPLPGSLSGRGGAATDQSINYSFNVTVLATDNWWNPVTGVTDVVRITSDDPLATLPPDEALVDGQAEMSMRLARGGYNQITVSDVSQPSIPGSTTQVRAISSGFHLEASVSPASARAGEPFTLLVKVTNDAGSVIQEINSEVTVEVRNASTNAPGQRTLTPSSFQLLQGQRSVLATYTFVEPIVIIARDDAGNAPATSNVIDITPGLPDSILVSSVPNWVGGNKHATVTARLVDEFKNGIPGEVMTFSRTRGTGTITPIDSLTVADGVARADYLSARTPEMGTIRCSSNGLITDFDLETALVDPYAAGGHVTNYPNPFHPPNEPTTIAYKLDADADVTLRIFTLSGDLVLRRTFDRGAQGGTVGLNEVPWDGKNGEGRVVASGGYLALIEAQGVGETLHVIRRKIAVVR
ncbi:MAG TPA: FlgD immunoglobulin-like domain containing protein [Candidatus Eisenbacteria bacterium]|nr:FlgD immunoglobulin-like domain containing protein [Candidatus Eisenbacteria bacterium]